MSDGHALQDVSGFGQMQARYLRVALLVASAIYLVRAWEPQGTTALLALRLAMAALCLAGAFRLPKERAPAPSLLRLGLLLVLAINLAVAWAEAPHGFPFNLLVLPAFAVIATLLGGSGLGTTVVVASAVVAGALFAVVGTGEPGALVTLKAANVGMATLLTYVYSLLLSSLLGDGLSALSGSVAALQSTREATRRLSQDLSDRVTSAVAALARDVDGGRDAGAAVEAVTAVLGESRRSLPAEPKLPEIDVPGRLLAMRRRLASRVLRLGLAALVVNVIVHLALRSSSRPRFTLPSLSVAIALVLVLIVLDALRPRWFVGLTLVFQAVVTSVMIYAVFAWLAVRPALPPGTVYWGFIAIIGTAIAGPRVGALQLLIATACLEWGGASHPPFDWTLPVNLLLANGLVCWFVDDMPRQLVARLSGQRAEAAREIRLRRRLVATLFHDLANPLTVVQSTVLFLSEGTAEPGDVATLRDMVARMQSILEAAMGRERDLHTVSAGHLFHAMDLLFSARLRSKGVALKTHGPAGAQVLCRETLLTESVLGNLVSNALKFSPPGAEIDLRVEEKRDSVVIAVEDRGPGLPADVREALATGRSSVSRLGTGGEQGHGHGLMLAQDYVREMGGSLELAEREGGGLSARILLKAG